MIFIAAASIVVIALGISRFIALRRESDQLSKFLLEWNDVPATVDQSKYISACQMGPNSVFEMATSLRRYKYSRKEAADKIESVARTELSQLETGLGTIATLASATPLLGFLGTVTGMIRAFMQIQNLGGNVNANVLAGGIWEALVTTAAGLAVGIVALIIHNYLAVRVKKVAGQLESVGEITLRILRSNNEG